MLLNILDFSEIFLAQILVIVEFGCFFICQTIFSYFVSEILASALWLGRIATVE